MKTLKLDMTSVSRVKLFGFLFLFCLLALMMVPFVYLFVSSVKDMGQFYSTNFRDVWFPSPQRWSNYIDAVTMVPLFRYVFNSLWLAFVQVLLAVMSSALVAYGFSRFQFPGRNVLFIIMLSSMMLPQQVTNIPLFLFFRTIGWTNSFRPLIVPFLFGVPWNIFLIRQFMMTIPLEFDEAAKMDGCGSLRIFWSIILPQAIPVLMVSGINTFLWSWKELLGPLIYISDGRLYTLPLGLLFFESPTGSEFTIQLAAVVIALIPSLLVFFVAQRYLIKGIVIGEVK
ncbi:carbohydrate ABC transporter permease [Spirochaeta dissipatitropha]